jgi:hypothetical protein
MADGNIHPFYAPTHRPSAASIAPAEVIQHPMANAFGFAPVAEPEDRYRLEGWFDGYAIYEGKHLICRFEGPCIDFAKRHLDRLLSADNDPLPEAA